MRLGMHSTPSFPKFKCCTMFHTRSLAAKFCPFPHAPGCHSHSICCTSWQSLLEARVHCWWPALGPQPVCHVAPWTTMLSNEPCRSLSPIASTCKHFSRRNRSKCAATFFLAKQRPRMHRHSDSVTQCIGWIFKAEATAQVAWL